MENETATSPTSSSTSLSPWSSLVVAWPPGVLGVAGGPGRDASVTCPSSDLPGANGTNGIKLIS